MHGLKQRIGSFFVLIGVLLLIFKDVLKPLIIQANSSILQSFN